MKIFLSLMMLITASFVSCDREDEDFTPYPGGKKSEEPREK